MVESEITGLLGFLANYDSGTVDNNIERIRLCFSKDFQLITASGRRLSKGQILGGISTNYNTVETAEYWAENIKVEKLSDTHYFATFDEYRKTNLGENKRVCTSIFEKDENAPFGIKWKHIQDTWIQD